MVDVWNNTDPDIKLIPSHSALKSSLCQTSPKPNPYFNLGKRILNIILARIRMECSELNSHLFENHIISNPLCRCGEVETTTHYFLDCPFYTLHRLRLSYQLGLLDVDFTVEILLYGTSNLAIDKIMIGHIDHFITATDRFSLITGLYD